VKGFFKRRWRWILGGSLPLLAVLLLLSYTPGFARPHRSPDQYETIMYFFAQELGEAALCDRISWSAYQRYSLLFGGGGASYWRSDCYEQVAEATHDASVCWKVRPLVDFDLFSSGYSALSCRRRTLSNYSSGIALSNDELIGIFQRLGYDADTLHVKSVIEPAIRVQDVYRGLTHNAAALTRAEQLVVRPVSSMPADVLGYLSDLSAIGSRDPKWCAYIPPNQWSDHQPVPFQDWCYFTLAYNTHNTSICDRMEPATAEKKVLDALAAGVKPEIAEQMSLHAECDRIGKSVESAARLYYGPELPPDAAEMRLIVAFLGVAMPSARDWPQGQLAAYYQQVLFALGERRPPNPTRDAARRELVRRLLTLPVSVGTDTSIPRGSY
jgi:hypothetical protein